MAPDFVNTNPHPIGLRQSDERDDLRMIPPGPFTATGRVADEAGETEGVVKANSDEADAYTEDGTSAAPGVDRTRDMIAGDKVSEAVQAAAVAALSPNSDRYVGDPTTGAIQETPIGTPARNIPSVDPGSIAAGVVENIIPAGPNAGQPAPGSGYPTADGLNADGTDVAGIPTMDGEVDPDPSLDEVDYNDFNKQQLRETATDRGLDVSSSATKPEIVSALEEDDERNDGVVTSADVPRAT